VQDDLAVYNQTARGDIKELRDRVGQLEKQVKELGGRLDQMATERKAFSPPTGGRIRLMNTFTTPMSIRVNDRVYRLEPGQTQMLDAQPVGAFTYEVLGVQGPVTRVLAANETYTIYVYPR
jgi:hypothetical protein